MPRAYSITTEAIAAERQRVGGNLSEFDVSRVIRLDVLELRAVGVHDVHLRILAASAEHNVVGRPLHEVRQPLRGGRGDDERKGQREEHGASTPAQSRGCLQ